MSFLQSVSQYCGLLTCAAVALWSFQAWSTGAWRALPRRFAVVASSFAGPRTAPAAGRFAAEPPRRQSRPAPRAHALKRRLPSVPAPHARPAVDHRRVIAAGVPMHVVQVDLNRPEVRITVATAHSGIGYRENWSAIIDHARPTAAITGTYFDVKSALPVGSIIIGGQQVCQGLVGTAFTFSARRGAQLIACRPGIRSDWSHFDTVLRAGPRLLTGGRRTLWPRDEGFRDPAIWRHKRRTAVALTRHGKLLLVAVQKPILLRTLARGLQTLGAVDAMCLDGGSSTGLYFRGKTWVKPARPLTNLLVVYDSAAGYRSQLARRQPRDPQVAQSPTGDTAG